MELRKKTEMIVVHCAATKAAMDIGATEIKKWHVDDNGWDDIGYHYVIYLDGSIHEGRPVERMGAHCKGQNKGSIGIAYVGGIDKKHLKPKDTRTKAQKDALIEILKEFKHLYCDLKIYGHRDFSSKACPSFDAKEEYKEITNAW